MDQQLFDDLAAARGSSFWQARIASDAFLMSPPLDLNVLFRETRRMQRDLWFAVTGRRLINPRSRMGRERRRRYGR